MSTATDMRDKYLAAELSILAGQDYTWGTRRLSLPDLAEIRAGREEWERRVINEQARARGGTPGVALANFTRCD